MDHAYRQALTTLIARHGDVVASAFRMRTGFLTDREMCLVLDCHLGHVLRRIYFRHGFLAIGHLRDALDTLPEETRHPRAVLRALDRHDRETGLNQRLDEIAVSGPLFQPALERAFRKRRATHMRVNLSRMIRNHRATAMAVHRVLDQIADSVDTTAEHPHTTAHLDVVVEHIDDGERYARSAAVWAIKAGFPLDRISDALVRLYIHPMRGVIELLERMEMQLRPPVGRHFSDRAGGSVRRIALELMDTADALQPSHQSETGYTRRSA